MDKNLKNNNDNRDNDNVKIRRVLANTLIGDQPQNQSDRFSRTQSDSPPMTASNNQSTVSDKAKKSNVSKKISDLKNVISPTNDTKLKSFLEESGEFTDAEEFAPSKAASEDFELVDEQIKIHSQQKFSQSRDTSQTNLQPDEKRILDILMSEKTITEYHLKKAQSFAQKNNTSSLGYFIDEGVISKDALGRALAKSINIPFLDINLFPPSKNQVLKIQEDFAKKNRVLVLDETNEKITIATDRPWRKGLLDGLKQLFPLKEIALGYILTESLDAAFVYYRKPLETRFLKIIETQKRVAPEIVGEIFEDAFAYRSSDIHFEPQGKNVVIRFRIDGVLHEAGRIEKVYYDSIINLLKVMARLRIDEHFSAQDGAFRYQKKNSDITLDMRLSIIPTLDGEKAVIRLLASYVSGFGLSGLGISARDRNLLEKAAAKPFGMILVSGPTGSGKSTTLYAILRMLNKPEVNITTIEDPVEYKITGVNQIQVNPRMNLTFSQGLRSIVRQDPDVILVGEIRDKETAEIAVNAALTGHLLLSTFHSNDAATALPRLLDMGVEPFLLASTLELIVAQRLVRKSCVKCRYSYNVGIEDIKKNFPDVEKLVQEKEIVLYRSKGCAVCSGSGFRGRTAIYEFINVTPEMEELILKNPSTKEVWELARKQHSHSLFEDGFEKVLNGTTTIEELLRVASP
ncbi:MAG: type IV pilus assembly protein PilB [Candidatus Berkelbacteria bacterium Licking1014_7]|uniref:Type IV pilus assembly protein PilB n=1 Tax=Candidatus Berkelbacteria bacterium Licking1014_7 TaxID=2017147 RepID=A0A554LHU3_9BACT|nr:MAG: type IV pilus assembly protein PilB [Candidatus Berkelbacteria bacterium Licking1014_7]